MSEPFPRPAPYRVAYSGRVREDLRDLLARARNRGLGREAVAAVQEMDRRLHIYPQFGDPLRDLRHAKATVWIGCVPPLVVHYILNEETRTVMVVVPITPLTRSGFDP